MFDSWYQNVGKLLQRIAKIGFIVEAICCMIGGIIMAIWALAEGIFLGFLLAPIVAFLAILFAFLSSLPLYGMGILIESAELNIAPGFRRSYAPRRIATEQSSQGQDKQPTCEQAPQQPTYPPRSFSMQENHSESNNHEPIKTPQKKVSFEEKPFEEQLEYALKYQTDDGLIRCLKQIKDDRINQILAQPISQIRAHTEKLLNTLRTVTVSPQEDGKIICPKCGTKQPANRKICFHCEVPFQVK